MPRVSVVMATRNRPARLAAALASLRAQTLPAADVELVLVDDASTDPAQADVLAAAERDGARVLRRATPGGPGGARNEGWRAASAPLVAFTDDDCELDPRWLEAGLAAWDGTDRCFVQGPTLPIEREVGDLGLWSYAIQTPAGSLEFETCNVFYPRGLLAALGGFDATTFPVAGEDMDLAWRAKALGARSTFAPDAVARHAVVRLGPVGLLRRALHWSDVVGVFARHPEARRARLIGGLFWNWSHYLLARAALAPLVPRRFGGALRWWLAAPLLRFEATAARQRGGGLRHVPWLLLHDATETAAMVRGSVRHRTPVL